MIMYKIIFKFKFRNRLFIEIGTQSFYNAPGFLLVLAYNKTAYYLYMKQFLIKGSNNTLLLN